MSETKRCPKPGCGAQKIVGMACYDWDCPQQTLTATEHNGAVAAIVGQNAKLLEALKPFADAVFNDNGDITVSPVHEYDDYVRAYFVAKQVGGT